MTARDPIAVIGAACRLPGGADKPEAFWEMLCTGRDAIDELPAGRWDDTLHDPDRRKPGRIYTRAGAFLPAVDGFDPEFFGVSPREAISLDPQHRLLLELAWEAVEGAGIAATSLRGSRTGVFVGIGQPQHGPHELFGPNLAAIGPYAGTGALLCFASGRVSHFLGLRGPSLSVDTACSSSLVALHLACRSLRYGECDLALVAGVHLHLTPQVSLFLARTGVLAPDGRTKAFDAAADGFGRGEGGVVLLLRRLPEAISAGDAVLGLVRGTAVNHDGAASGLTVPDAAAQEEVIRAALRDAGATPAEIGLIEAHGTGTRLGDPIEAEALARVFAPEGAAIRDTPLILGAVKANIGHLEAAAGLAGVLKVMLALRHHEVPPQPGFRDPNPDIPWSALPFRVPRGSPMPAPALRLAGVSSFGMSGSNAHVVLEAPPPTPMQPAPANSPTVLVVSAHGEAALGALARDTRDTLAAVPEEFVGLAAQSRSGRSLLRHRIALVAENAAEATAALEGWLREGAHPALARGDAVAGRRGGLAFLFTGQGAQRPGMGRALYAAEPAFRIAFDRCAAVLDPLLKVPLSHLVLEECDAELLRRTGNAQPALFAFEWALSELWRSWGVEPDLVLGHSLGEYVAATVAGCWTLEESLALVATRARLMQALPSGGAMASLRVDVARAAAVVAPYAGRLSVAAHNAPRLTVISGESAALSEVLARCASEGIVAQRLQVSHAFHSALMDPILPALRDAIAACPPRPPAIELVCNLTGEIAEATELTDPDRWCRHTRQAVRFANGVATLATMDVAAFLEIGPAPVLTGLAQQGAAGHGALFLPSLSDGFADARQIRQALAALIAAGLAEPPRAPKVRPSATLPRYPFQRRPIPLPGGAASGVATQPATSLPGTRLSLAGSAEARFEIALPGSDPFLSQHLVNGEIIVPAAWNLAAVVAAVRALHPGETITLRDMIFAEPARLEGGGLVVQVALSPRAGGGWRFELMSRAAAEDPFAPDVWRRHTSGDAAAGGPPLSNAPPIPEGGEQAWALYETVAGAGFALGPSFRWLRHIRAEGDALVAALAAPAELAPVPGAPTHPGLLDSAFQLLSRFWSEQGASFLPFRLDIFSLAARPAGVRGLRVLAQREKAAEPGGSPPAGLLLADEAGTVMEAHGFAFRRFGAATPARPAARKPAPMPTDMELEARIRSAVAGVLGIADPAGIEPRARLFDLGMDSMAALEARDAIEAALGRPLHATLLFDHPTIAALLAHLAPVPDPADAVAAGAVPDETEIAAMSEEEAERLLLLEIEKEG